MATPAAKRLDSAKLSGPDGSVGWHEACLISENERSALVADQFNRVCMLLLGVVGGLLVVRTREDGCRGSAFEPGLLPV